MPRSPATRPLVHRPAVASTAALWIGWSVYTILALVGFCFGVWAGSQKPKPVEVARAAPVPPEGNKQPDKGTDKPDVKPAPEQKVTPAPQPTPPANAEPPKPPEAKKDEPKKDTPKKDDSMKAEPPAAAVTFAKDILPVFRANCLNCHGATGKPRAGLDLRTLASVTKGGENGPVVKPGDPAASPLLTTVEDGVMPKNAEPLSAGDKKLIRDWILGGAK